MREMAEDGEEIGAEAQARGNGLRDKKGCGAIQIGEAGGNEEGQGVCVPLLEPVNHEMWKVLKYRSREIEQIDFGEAKAISF